MIRFSLVGVALIGLLSGACSDRTADRGGSAPGEGGGATGAAQPSGAPSGSPNAIAGTRITAADAAFVKQAAVSNELEVEMAKVGQDKATNDGVKDFARQLEQDHSEALDELRGVANLASVQLDRHDDDAQRASLNDKIGHATGRQFDAQFVRLMIEDHKKDIAEFEKQQVSATGDLKAFVDKTLPVMREHLQKAEALQAQLGGNTNRGQ